MNFSSVYHIATDNFCFALNEDELIIRVQTGYDVDRVELVYGDPFMNGIFGSKDSWGGDLKEITNKKYLQNHIIWQTSVKPAFKRCRYYFILHSNNEAYYFTEDGFRSKSEFKDYKGRRQDFFFPWMNPIDIIKPAKWVNDTVWYQIFPDRFCNSGTKRYRSYDKWASPKKKMGYLDRYGGDLKGITSKLDYLKDLGINGIYFTPLNKSNSNHKYNTTDYTMIDPDFGTDEDLITLVKEAHSRGIRIMLDGVFNHSGDDFAPWLDVLENGEESKYFNWFMINEVPKKVGMFTQNARKGKYYTFGFFDNMPKLNTNNQEVIDYFINICVNWVNKYDIDAIRLDVANEMSHSFNRQLRQAMLKLNPNFYICGEIWHNAMPWLRGDEYDAVMNYTLQESIDSFWANKSTTALEFEHQINRCLTLYPQQITNVMFNLLDSHDTMRLITRSNENIDVFYQKLAVLFTLNGTTCIYYGTEIALSGGYDPDCRRCMPWNCIEKGQYNDKIENVKKLIDIRKSYDELKNGEIRFIHLNNRVIAYEKYGTNNTIRVIVNCTDNDFIIYFDYKDILFSNGLISNTLKENGVVVLLV
ncbi:MAG: glycoside hydrolase family 13 protein [Acutalibacteraceae bacterium]|nr:glycoside hydrolase family 13 protein [Acutalibacteraceae bacterium]